MKKRKKNERKEPKDEKRNRKIEISVQIFPWK